jgi:citrate lyase subunit beta/citryl-CoA lyase
MRLRSLLFVPGDSERKFDKAARSGADALILDLEDSVAPSNKNAARELAARLLDRRDERDWSSFVRVNALDSGLMLDDLAAVARPGLDALMIPKVNGAADVERIGFYLDALETRAEMPVGSVKLAILATETAKAMFALGSYAPAHPRLVALTWGAGSSATAAHRAATDSPAAWPFTRIRSPSSIAAIRRLSKRSSVRAESSPPSMRIPAPGQSGLTARWSTSRI